MQESGHASPNLTLTRCYHSEDHPYTLFTCLHWLCRVIQRADQPIILTGFQTLNKLLGRPVYSSQLQLGGPRVMGANGVSQHIVASDFEGVQATLRWLSFLSPQLPSRAGSMSAALAAAALSDPVDRPVEYVAGDAAKFDVRAAIEGQTGPDGSWRGGLCDRGSWVESQSGWARTVVTGRARLGGRPVAVLGVEAETVMLSVPADPGSPESTEQVIPQAGQVCPSPCRHFSQHAQ
jgi:acetyl-CoA carboxylase / biotin carboxylase 1